MKNLRSRSIFFCVLMSPLLATTASADDLKVRGISCYDSESYNGTNSSLVRDARKPHLYNLNLSTFETVQCGYSDCVRPHHYPPVNFLRCEFKGTEKNFEFACEADASGKKVKGSVNEKLVFLDGYSYSLEKCMISF